MYKDQLSSSLSSMNVHRRYTPDLRLDLGEAIKKGNFYHMLLGTPLYRLRGTAGSGTTLHRPAQPSVWCGQLWQDLVYIRAKLYSIHIRKTENKYTYKYMHNFMCTLYTSSAFKKYTLLVTGKCAKQKSNIHTFGYGVAILNTFSQSDRVNVCEINGSWIHKTVSLIYLGFKI